MHFSMFFAKMKQQPCRSGGACDYIKGGKVAILDLSSHKATEAPE